MTVVFDSAHICIATARYAILLEHKIETSDGNGDPFVVHKHAQFIGVVVTHIQLHGQLKEQKVGIDSEQMDRVLGYVRAT
jgi:hypothetical protein